MKAAITIDVDSLRFYMQIHGLSEEAPPIEEDPIYTVALPRFFELLSALELPATLFLIGEDAPAHARLFAPLQGTRSEVASHSFSHDYRLTRQSPAAIAEDLRRAHEALLPLAPRGEVVGFRAPGYNTCPALLEAALGLGYRYDSSLLPSPSYFALRAAAIGRYALSGAPSSSLIGDPRAFSGPLSPHRTTPRAPWRKVKQGPLLELPIACAPGSRVPLIGTTWTILPAQLRRSLLRDALKRLPLFNFEMHAIDLLDQQDKGVPRSLAQRQRDLRVPIKEKLIAFSELFSTLRQKAKVMPLSAISD